MMALKLNTIIRENSGLHCLFFTKLDDDDDGKDSKLCNITHI